MKKIAEMTTSELLKYWDEIEAKYMKCGSLTKEEFRLRDLMWILRQELDRRATQ